MTTDKTKAPPIKTRKVPTLSVLDRSLSPFGLTKEVEEPLTFKGTSEELSLALEDTFKTKPVGPKLKTKIKTKTGLKAKLKTTSKPVKPISTVAGSKPIRNIKRKPEVALEPFDRNRGGVSKVELARAKHKIANVVEVPKRIVLSHATRLRRINNEMAEYLLLNVAPFDSALDTAVVDAAEMLKMMTGVQTAEFRLSPAADRNLRRLTELKLLDWSCRKLKLPSDIRELVINDYLGNPNASSKKLHELQPASAMSRSEERRESHLSQSQIRGLGRSIVEALGRKNPNRKG